MVPVGNLIRLHRWGPIGVGVAGVGTPVELGSEPLDGHTPQLLQVGILVQDGHGQLGPGGGGRIEAGLQGGVTTFCGRTLTANMSQ